MAHARVWMSMGSRPSAVLPSSQAETVLCFFLFWLLKQKTPPNMEPRCSSTWCRQLLCTLSRVLPPHPTLGQWHRFENQRYVRWGGQTWEVMVGVMGVYPSTLLTHPILVSVFFSLGFFFARIVWQRTHAAAPPPPHTHTHTNSFKMFSHLWSSVWGAAVGGAGCGSHGHARGAGGSYRLPDVRHEEGVAG